MSRNRIFDGKADPGGAQTTECQNQALPTKASFTSLLLKNPSQVKWFNVALLIFFHICLVLGLICIAIITVKVRTVAFTYLIGSLSGFGLTVGAHRLWAHRSFKARLPLRLFLVFFQTLTMNGSVLSFARDHRTHHKYSDTEGDPKNPSRGLFYSHFGWWMLKKTQTVKDHGNKLDFTDLTDDWMLYWQHRLYAPLFIILGLIIPILIPILCWNENPLTSFFINTIRIIVILNHYSTVNSLAHYFGARPYDYRMRPTENRLIVYLSFGEGNHNFHHAFAYDYTTSEAALWESFNPSTLFISFCALFGQAYNCKRASKSAIEGTIKRVGVPAYFDPPRGLCFRIASGAVDWTLGLIVIQWPVLLGLACQFITGSTIFV